MSTSTTNKYRVRELAKDFGLNNKDVMEILGKYGEAPKSNMQALTDDELSLVFESLTQAHPVASIQEIFADTYQESKKKDQPTGVSAPAASASVSAEQPAQTQRPAAPGAQSQKDTPPAAHAVPTAQPAAIQAKSALQQPTTRVPQKKVVDTRKSGDVNLAKYDERLEQMAPEKAQRMQAPSGNKQKFRPNNNRRPTPGMTFSNKRRQDEQEKMRRLQLEIAKKAPLKVSIPDEISVGELASRMETVLWYIIRPRAGCEAYVRK